MKADTAGFIAMQRVYIEKAKKDRESIRLALLDVLQSAGLPTDFFIQEEIDIFCKNARYIKYTSGKCLSKLLDGRTKDNDACMYTFCHRSDDLLTFSR